ncbi:MAG: addiction module protein [Pirellulales bacterium]
MSNFERLEIERLSVAERLELVDRILESLPEELHPDEVPAWHLAELTERRRRLAEDPQAGRPWRDALARYGASS